MATAADVQIIWQHMGETCVLMSQKATVVTPNHQEDPLGYEGQMFSVLRLTCFGLQAPNGSFCRDVWVCLRKHC